MTERTAKLRQSQELYQEHNPSTISMAFSNKSKRKKLDFLFKNHVIEAMDSEADLSKPRKAAARYEESHVTAPTSAKFSKKVISTSF